MGARERLLQNAQSRARGSRSFCLGLLSSMQSFLNVESSARLVRPSAFLKYQKFGSAMAFAVEVGTFLMNGWTRTFRHEEYECHWLGHSAPTGPTGPWSSQVSREQVRMYLVSQPDVPWITLRCAMCRRLRHLCAAQLFGRRYIIAEVNYGGRVTDDKEVSPCSDCIPCSSSPVNPART